MPDLIINVADFTQEPLESARVSLTPLYDYSIAGNNIIAGDTLAQTSNVSGSVTFSKVVSGNYTLGIFGPYKSTSVILAVTGTGILNAKDLFTASTYTPENEFAYSRAQSDALFVHSNSSETISGIKYFAGQIEARNGIADPSGSWIVDQGRATFASVVSNGPITISGNPVSTGNVSLTNVVFQTGNQLISGSKVFMTQTSFNGGIIAQDGVSWSVGDGGDAIFNTVRIQDGYGLTFQGQDTDDYRIFTLDFQNDLQFSNAITVAGTVSSNQGNTTVNLNSDNANSPEIDFLVSGGRHMVFGYDASVARGVFYGDSMGGGVYFYDNNGLAMGGGVSSYAANLVQIPKNWQSVLITGLTQTNTFGVNVSLLSANSNITKGTTLLSGVNVTGTLPSAVDGAIYTIKQITAATGVVKGNGSQTIDGSNTRTLSGQYKSVTVQAYSNNWYVVSNI